MRPFLAGLLATSAIVAAAAPARAATGGPPPAPPSAWAAANAAAYQRAQADLVAAQAAEADLDQQLAGADQQVVAAQQKAADDKQKVDALKLQIGQMARSSYQVQGSQLSSILDARSIGELWDALAEQRLVSDRQKTLLDQLEQLRRTDERARDRAVAHRDSLSYRRSQVQIRLAALQGRVGVLAFGVLTAGQILSSPAGRVPSERLPQTGGLDGQCTWFAEQAWLTYSDPNSPKLLGDGADVVPMLAQALGRPYTLEPTPGALVSWRRPLMSQWGHVAYVASVDRDGSGNLAGYTVWEMNFEGPFISNARHIAWGGPNALVVFMSPPNPVDPVAAEASKLGPR